MEMQANTDKKVNQEVSEQEGLNQILIEESPFPILQVNKASGQILESNPAFFQLYGFTQTEQAFYYDQLCKKKKGVQPPKRKLPVPKDGIKTHYTESKTAFRVEEKWRPWPGNKATLFLQLLPLENKEYINSTEVPPPKDFEILAQSAYDIIWTTDLRLKFTYATPSIKKLTGFTQEEFIGTSLSDHCTKKEFKRMAKIAMNALKNFKSCKNIRIEGKTLKKDGSKMPVEVIAKIVFNRFGLPIGFQGTTRDISERIKARNEVQDEKRLLTTLINNLPDRIYFKTRDSKFIITNQAVVKHIGLKDEAELVGKSDADFYPTEHAARYLEDEQRIMESGIPSLNFEEPARNPDGKTGWTLSSKIPIKNQQNEVIGLVGISRDITEIKNAQKDLILAKEKAEQSNRLKDSFIANVSHEIRTPLNAILGFSSLMKDEYEESGSISSGEFFGIIQNSGQRLMRTIEMILNLSRVETGEFSTYPKELSINMLISQFTNDYSLPAKQKSLNFEIINNCSRKTLNSDEYAVCHSISNIIDNAIKYTQEGFVKVEFSNPKEGLLQVVVNDSGIGISQKYLPNLFEPYSQEEDGYTRSFEGIGLGLSLTSKLIRLIDSHISVNSHKGKGSCFTLIFTDLPL